MVTTLQKKVIKMIGRKLCTINIKAEQLGFFPFLIKKHGNICICISVCGYIHACADIEYVWSVC